MHRVRLFGLIIWVCGCFLCTSAFAQEVAQFSQVCIRGRCIKVRVAKTEKERAQGLSEVVSLNPDEGMLFVFDLPNIPKFWMNKMRFNIDVVWISSEKKIIDITQDCLPCFDNCPTFSPRFPIVYVLEVNSGLVKATGIQEGDFVSFVK